MFKYVRLLLFSSHERPISLSPPVLMHSLKNVFLRSWSVFVSKENGCKYYVTKVA